MAPMFQALLLVVLPAQAVAAQVDEAAQNWRDGPPPGPSSVSRANQLPPCETTSECM
jgi:hypothetical protein